MLQFAGVGMALATFFCIWGGHVGVRWLEARSPDIWLPATVLSIAGVILNIFALFAPTLALSGIASIIGITLLWDALEMYRQQHRVQKGHAPANPNNPRHAAYLAAGLGTTENLLEREPRSVDAPAPSDMPRRAATAMARRPERDYVEVEA